MVALAGYVHIVSETGAPVVFGPSDEVPEWAYGQISNPKAWVGGEAPEVESANVADFPEGEPSTDWSGKQLAAYAAAQEPPVDVSVATNKAGMVEILTAAASA